jgi:serine/threonine protein kinase
MRRDELKSKSKEANAFGNMMSALHWMGLRDVFEEFLPVLMNMVLKQKDILDNSTLALSVSVSPFDMLYYVRQTKPGESTLATPRMLEFICIAHAEIAKRQGNELLRNLPAPSPWKRESSEAPRRVVFYEAGLFQPGPVLNLVGEAILKFASLPGVDVWVFGDGPVDSKYPPAKDLTDFFQARNRLVVLEGKDDREVLEEFCKSLPDAVFSFPGWTHGDRAAVLSALSGLDVFIFNTLGYAGPMHMKGFVTLAGVAMGKSQLESTTRERLALFGPGDTYQPPQSHPYLNVDKAESRSDWGLPDNFIMFFPATSNQLGKKTIFLYLDLLCMPDFSDAILVLLDRPETMRPQIYLWLQKYIVAKSCGSAPDLRSRIIFRPFSDGAKPFYGLIDVISNGGEGGLGIGSFDSVGPHTCAQDALKCGLVVFTTMNPDGLMADRVTAEVLEAAGLGDLCVGTSDADTVDKIVRYKRCKQLRLKARQHLQEIQHRQLGLFNDQRIPTAWMAVLNHYLLQDRGNLQDFQIPQDQNPAPRMTLDITQDFKIPQDQTPAASPAPRMTLDITCVDAIVGQLKGTEPEMQEVIRQLLTGLESQRGVTFICVEGSGTSVNTVCCKLADGQLAALKLAKASHPQNRIHNCPVTREAAIILAAHEHMRKHEFKDIFPEPMFILDGGTSFFGTTVADSRGRVIPFLICEFIIEDFWGAVSSHGANWQERGLLPDDLRLKVFCPLHQALYYAHDNGFAISDLKPDSVRWRKNGRPVFTALGLGHWFGTVKSSNGQLSAHSAQEGPCLLSRKQSTRIEHERAALGRRARQLPRGLVHSPKPKPGALFVPIPRLQLRDFWRRACTRGLAMLGSATRGFVDTKLAASMEMWRRAVVEARPLKALDRTIQLSIKKCVLSSDRYALHRTLLLLLTKKKGEALDDWDARATEAGKREAANEKLQQQEMDVQDTAAAKERFKKMFLDALNTGVVVQQETALERMVDFFTLALGPGTRFCDSAEAMTHQLNTLPFLPPDWDQALRRGKGMKLAGGCVKELFNCPYPELCKQKLPALEFAVQPDMGMGARAMVDIEAGTVLGAYVGPVVPSPETGARNYVTSFYPSRYQVSIFGNVPLLKERDVNKLACDAQPTLDRNVEWARKRNAVGPYMNAAWSDAWSDAETLANESESDEAAEADSEADGMAKMANCKVDRVRAWIDADTSLLCMLVISSKKIPKGQFLMWRYDPRAGPGCCWSFR